MSRITDTIRVGWISEEDQRNLTFALRVFFRRNTFIAFRRNGEERTYLNRLIHDEIIERRSLYGDRFNFFYFTRWFELWRDESGCVYLTTFKHDLINRNDVPIMAKHSLSNVFKLLFRLLKMWEVDEDCSIYGFMDNVNYTANPTVTTIKCQELKTYIKINSLHMDEGLKNLQTRILYSEVYRNKVNSSFGPTLYDPLQTFQDVKPFSLSSLKHTAEKIRNIENGREKMTPKDPIIQEAIRMILRDFIIELNKLKGFNSTQLCYSTALSMVSMQRAIQECQVHDIGLKDKLTSMAELLQKTQASLKNMGVDMTFNQIVGNAILLG